MHGQLGLGLEPGRSRGKRFHIASREHAVAGQHVTEASAEQEADAARKQLVSEAVARPVGRLVGLVIHPRSHHHVAAAQQHPINQIADVRHIVGAVAIAHHVDIGFHVSEHSAHHIALAAQGHPMHHRAGLRGQHRRVVGGRVIEHMNGCFRQHGAKVSNDLPHRASFVVARQHDRNHRRHGRFVSGRTKIGHVTWVDEGKRWWLVTAHGESAEDGPMTNR